MDEKKYPKWMQIIPLILFFSWFVGSLIAMFYFCPKSAHIGMMFVGQYFIVFGFFISNAKQKFDSKGNPIILSKGEKKYENRPVGIIMIFFGSIIFAFCSILEWGSENIINILKENETPLMLVFLILFAVSFSFYSIWENRKLSKDCCEKVVATVVDLAQRRFERQLRYYPVISYEYDCKVYTLQSKSSSNIFVPKIGDDYDILVNPDNPEDFISSTLNKITFLFYTIIAVCFVIGCGIGLYNFYF